MYDIFITRLDLFWHLLYRRWLLKQCIFKFILAGGKESSLRVDKFDLPSPENLENLPLFALFRLLFTGFHVTEWKRIQIYLLCTFVSFDADPRPLSYIMIDWLILSWHSSRCTYISSHPSLAINATRHHSCTTHHCHHRIKVLLVLHLRNLISTRTISIKVAIDIKYRRHRYNRWYNGIYQ